MSNSDRIDKIIKETFEEKDPLRKKLGISLLLIGENESHFSSPVFYHIRSVLQKFQINSIEAKNILLDMKGAYSPEMNTNIIDKIIHYLKEINDVEFININEKSTSAEQLVDRHDQIRKKQKIKHVQNLKKRVLAWRFFNRPTVENFIIEAKHKIAKIDGEDSKFINDIDVLTNINESQNSVADYKENIIRVLNMLEFKLEFEEETIPTPSSFKNVPHRIISIYTETIEAYYNNINLLCAGGLRTTIEAICKEQKITGGNIRGNRSTDLEGKINGLFENGLITESHRDILHEQRFLGNQALHFLEKPSSEELLIAIEILGITLNTIYELKSKAAELYLKKEKRKN